LSPSGGGLRGRRVLYLRGLRVKPAMTGNRKERLAELQIRDLRLPNCKFGRTKNSAGQSEYYNIYLKNYFHIVYEKTIF